MIDLLKEISFAKELEQSPQMKPFIIEAAKKVEVEEHDALRKIKKPQIDQQLQNHFIISGIPKLTPENQKKFVIVFKSKILDPKEIGQKNGLQRIDVGGQANQTLYMVYRTQAQAKQAFHKLNHLKFDPMHTLTCFTIRQIQDVLNFKDEYIPPTILTVADKIVHNVDAQNRNQFAIRQANQIYINWLDQLDRSAINALDRGAINADQHVSQSQTVNKMLFSPKGNYLAVCTTVGINLYAGQRMIQKALLKQQNPQDIKFSNNQQYLISFNGASIKSRQNFIIWAIQSEIKLKSYKAYPHQSLDSFQFSTNSANLAVATNKQIIFYRVGCVQDFKRQLRCGEQQSHTFPAINVQKLSWLVNNVSVICLCYEVDYDPTKVPATRVIVYNAEIREQRKWRAWSDHAKNGEIVVSERGTWVAILMRKFIKKNHFATVIQIGNLTRKQQPIEVTSLQVKQEVGNVSWDDRNDRFAVVQEDETTKKGINVRHTVTFYSLINKDRSLEVVKIHQIRNNLQNRVLLTKNGVFFALYNVSEESPEKGRFSLGFITKQKEKPKKLVIDFLKHNVMINGMSSFSADSSGRFILIGTEKSYQVWSFIGEIITKDTMQRNIQDLQWRPRIETVLDEKEERMLVEKQKEIRKKYEEIDRQRADVLKYQKEESKRKQKIQFLGFIGAKREWYKKFVAMRNAFIGFNTELARTDTYEIEQIIEVN